MPLERALKQKALAEHYRLLADGERRCGRKSGGAMAYQHNIAVLEEELRSRRWGVLRMANSEQQLQNKVDSVTAQMGEMLHDYGLEGISSIWAHKVRDWLKVLSPGTLTVKHFAHYKDPKYPDFTAIPECLREACDEK